MKNPILKANLRRPLKWLLLIIILFLSTVLFSMNYFTYDIVKTESEELKEKLNSIGYIEITDDNKYDITEAIDIIESDSMLKYETYDRYCSGIVESLELPLDITNDVFNIYQKISLRDQIFIAQFQELGNMDNSKYDPNKKINPNGIVIVAKLVDDIFGDNKYIQNEYDGMLHMPLLKQRPYQKRINEFVTEEVLEGVKELEVGKSYIFRAFPGRWNNRIIEPLYNNGPVYKEVNDPDNFDINAPEWAELKNGLEMLKINRKTLQIISSNTMETRPETQEETQTIFLKEGRWFDYEDNEKENKVCVINSLLAEKTGLQIGDTIDIRMLQNASGILIDPEYDSDDWRNFPTTEPIEYKIIGLYVAKYDQLTETKIIDIYVPSSTVPDEFGFYYNEDEQKLIYPEMYSFVLESPKYQKEFINKYEKALGEKGYKLNFIENRAEEFYDSIENMVSNLKNNVYIYLLLIIIVIIITVLMYANIYLLYYAIERSLGIPSIKSAIHLFSTFFVAGIIGVFGASYIGYQKAIEKSKEVLAQSFDSTVKTNTVDITAIIKISLLITILLLFVMIIKSISLKRSSIIDLINKKGKKKKKSLEEEIVEVKTDIKSIELESVYSLEKDNKSALKDYSKKQIFRALTNTGIYIMVTILFVGSLLGISHLIEKNKNLIQKAMDETIVYANINKADPNLRSREGNISSKDIQQLIDTELVEDYFVSSSMAYSRLQVESNGEHRILEPLKNRDYYEEAHAITILANNERLDKKDYITVNDIESDIPNILDLLNESYTLKKEENNYGITYAESESGYKGIPILASESAMKEYDLKIGDEIIPSSKEYNDLSLKATIVGTFSSYQIKAVGVGVSRSAVLDETFIYPMDALRIIKRDDLKHNEAEIKFNPLKNRELLERKSELIKIISESENSTVQNELKIWDEQLIKVIEPLEKNLSLLKVIYPLVLIVSIIVSFILSYLMANMKKKEAAMMRILGVKTKEVRKTLISPNIILLLLGLLISGVVAKILTINSYKIPTINLIMIIGGYLIAGLLGLFIAIRKITDKSPLEMLQVKE